MGATDAAKTVRDSLHRWGVEYVACYRPSDPYLVAYADRASVTCPPWQAVARCNGYPVYLHAVGWMVSGQANDNAPAE